MTTRDAILDGALHVMRTRGLARTTTKEIARASGFSEATLYKLFADKVDIFLSVLAERLPRVSVVSETLSHLVGKNSLVENLQTMVVEIERFYEASLPIAMSLFSDVDLLAKHRTAVLAHGGRPDVIVVRVEEYLRAEQDIGRVRIDAPAAGAAIALVGACMHQAFLACFHGLTQDTEPTVDRVNVFAAEVVRSILPSLSD